MITRISELQYKELVDISDGTQYGRIGDLEVDIETGEIKSIVVYGSPRALGLLGRKQDVVFPWSAVQRVGPNVILVKNADDSGGSDHPTTK